ncbi:hypothetical protein [Streptomyces sp. 4N124]|uniref:hypothetical protein n=1 Tax=Streptomyces sp. 4N124 TaxID=3457420 RepID=UPI003FD29A13
MTRHRKGLVLDFGGVLTTPLLPAALAFERREGLAEGTLRTGLYLNSEGIRLTEDLERGTLTQTQWNEAAAGLLGIPPDNLMGRIFAELRQPAACGYARGLRVVVRCCLREPLELGDP